MLLLLWLESLNGMCAKLHTVAASNNRDHMPWSLYYCLFAPHIYGCSSCTSHLWWITHSMQCQRRGCNSIPSFLQWTALIARPFCEGWTWHDLHILAVAPFGCNRKAWTSSARSFTLWQQVTIEIMNCNHSVIACSCHRYMGVILHAHPFVVNRTFNATPTEVATLLQLFQFIHWNACSERLKTFRTLVVHQWKKALNGDELLFICDWAWVVCL